jgi:Short-chain alcohol dehydrogenase of unknown specificity
MSDERVAVVTGVGSGSLGEAIASSLRELGFRVLTSTRTCETTAETHAMELTSRDSVAAFAGWVQDSTERLDVLVNNAGIHLDLRSAGTSRTWSTAWRCTGAPTTWAPPS